MIGKLKAISFDGERFVVIEHNDLGMELSCGTCLYKAGKCHRAPIDCQYCDEDGKTVFWFREPTSDELKAFLEALVKSGQFADIQGSIIAHKKAQEEVLNSLGNMRDLITKIERLVK
jgi:hypothetical protein